MTDKDQKASAGSKSNDSDENLQRLSKDERMAFEKIVSEIGEGSSSPAAEEPAPEANPGYEAGDDQQAALDKIMTEINADAYDPSDETSSAPQAEADAAQPVDELDDEQQAALDKIMAEISGDRYDESSESETDGDQEDERLEPATGIQDALTSSTVDTTKSISENAGSKESDEGKPRSAAPTQQLTLEEFNEELNNLLSVTRTNPPSSDSDGDAPDQDGSTGQAHAEDENKSGADARDDDNTSKDCAIFHEVTPTDDRKPTSQKKNDPPKATGNHKSLRKLAYYATAALLVACIGAGVYWHFRMRNRQPAAAGRLSFVPAESHETRAETIPPKTGAATFQPAASPSVSNSTPSEKSTVVAAHGPLASLKDDIMAAREQVIDKLESVKELKAYYENGIAADRDKIRRAMVSSGVSSFKEAQQHRQIGLSLRSIQRRRLYVAKLEIPIRQLTSASEELLFLKRKSRMFETLNRGLSGLALSEFSQEVSTIIGNLLKLSNELSIDDVKVNTPKLESIWNAVRTADEKKPVSPDNTDPINDRKISQEICQGNFERKYLLTAIGADTAACLAKWPGKDLYLNGLTEISPSAAEALSQWPGEWLSLNGLKELSAEAAQQLARWNGKRLSLNGVIRLSKKATQHLYQWKGEQLEMVGLESIGRWENYGTRLYLSEKLRRKLQVQ